MENASRVNLDNVNEMEQEKDVAARKSIASIEDKLTIHESKWTGKHWFSNCLLNSNKN